MKMSDERRDLLTFGDGDPPPRLTQEEMDGGWHFCAEWDDLVVGPGTREWFLCTCPEKDAYLIRHGDG